MMRVFIAHCNGSCKNHALQHTDASNTQCNMLLGFAANSALVVVVQAKDLTDADIDAIIRKGEKDTNELNAKMQEFTENAMKFTLDGGMSAYDYKVSGENAMLVQAHLYRSVALVAFSGVPIQSLRRSRILCHVEH